MPTASCIRHKTDFIEKHDAKRRTVNVYYYQHALQWRRATPRDWCHALKNDFKNADLEFLKMRKFVFSAKNTLSRRSISRFRSRRHGDELPELDVYYITFPWSLRAWRWLSMGKCLIYEALKEGCHEYRKILADNLFHKGLISIRTTQKMAATSRRL